MIISDDLEMAAIADRYSMSEAIERGLHAGIDLLVCRRRDRVEESIEAVIKLAEQPKTAALVAAAARRAEAMIKRYVGTLHARILATPSASSKRSRSSNLASIPGGYDPTETAERV